MSDLSTLPILYRPAIEEDRPFIFNSWLKAFRKGTLSANVDNSIYYTNHHSLVERILSKSKTIICCNSDDPSIIYGYVTYQEVDGQFVLHFVYVKHIYRKLGLARQLLAETGHDFNLLGCYTHQTNVGIVKEEKYNLVYHPYILFTYV